VCSVLGSALVSVLVWAHRTRRHTAHDGARQQGNEQIGEIIDPSGVPECWGGELAGEHVTGGGTARTPMFDEMRAHCLDEVRAVSTPAVSTPAVSTRTCNST
jgi:hypothetical protein